MGGNEDNAQHQQKIIGKIRIFCISCYICPRRHRYCTGNSDGHRCDKASELDIYHIHPSSAPIYTYNKCCVGLNYS
jgi:hypothetical protein